MGQVTIYLDEDTKKKLNNAVKMTGISKSKWIAERIRENTAITWPETVKTLAGAWQDLPAVEAVRNGMGEDVKREPV